MPEIINIANGAEIYFVPNSRFHTTLISANFYLPLERKTVSEYALLSSVLTTCSEKYSDFRELNIKLSSLYGADISSSVSKTGDYLCLKFCASTIDDKYSFNGEKPLEETVELLLSLLFKPNIENNSFKENDLKREKRMLTEHIKGELNDKRLYARKRLTEEMFENEPYGIYRLGETNTIQSIDGEELYNAWVRMLETALVRINIIGKKIPDSTVESFKKAFAGINRTHITEMYTTQPSKERISPKYVCEYMDVAQGKLVMGFNCGSGDDSESYATAVMSDLFGGGPYSRLFTNVREKMSLCYYCSCYSVRNKGFLVVDSGVEVDNAQKAEEEILNQLSVLKSGNFTESELISSVKGISDSLLSANDSLAGLDSWYTVRAMQKQILSPEEFVEKIRKVTKEDIIKAAEKVNLNTVYKLLPKGDEKCE